MQIVGVVQDVKYEDIRAEPPPTVYVAYSQTQTIWPFMTYQLRTAGDMNAVARAIAPIALAVDPDVPVVNIRTQEEVLNQVLYLERTFALLSSVFGGLALALACVGVYGTIAYTVAQRTNEIGIRMALGAQRDNILQMVLRETLFVVAIGLAAGLPLSWLGTRLLSKPTLRLVDARSRDDGARRAGHRGSNSSGGICAGPASLARRSADCAALRVVGR